MEGLQTSAQIVYGRGYHEEIAGPAAGHADAAGHHRTADRQQQPADAPPGLDATSATAAQHHGPQHRHGGGGAAGYLPRWAAILLDSLPDGYLSRHLHLGALAAFPQA